MTRLSHPPAGVRVVEAAKAQVESHPTLLALDRAVIALRAAEEAEKRPRLRTADECYTAAWRKIEPMTGSRAVFTAGFKDRDAEWMAAIRKLPRHQIPRGVMAFGGGMEDAVAFSDIEALAESAK